MSSKRTAKTGSPHVRKRREQRQRDILHAALRAFRENGYHATTLDDIAEHVGVRKTALYHYFPDKEAILYACHRESLNEIRRVMKEAMKLETATERLGYVIREHVRVITGNLDGSPLALEVPALSTERQAEIVAARDRYERDLRKLVEQGVESGEFRQVDSKIAAFVILGAINWIARWYRPEGALHAPELGTEFVDHLMGGLACR